ncbi:MAG TPA: Uma2 family endonuclease [Allocoleopsis sp.]
MQTLIKNSSLPSENSDRNSIILEGISWSTFQIIMEEVGENRGWRITYDQGVLEIKMPHSEHEIAIRMLDSFIGSIADELEIEVMNIGSLTLERKDLSRAIEPDSCFYIQNESQIRGIKSIKLSNCPPPDLVIESDHTNSSLNKFDIYASLGVPEIWRYRNQNLEVYQLKNGQYEKSVNSLAFPFLPIIEISDFIEQSLIVGQRKTVKLFRNRIREILNNE